MAIIQNLEAFVQSYPAGLDSVTDLQLSQNENGRQIRFTIGGVTIPAGSVATISGTKPDGVVYSNTGTIEGSDTVIFNEDVQMTAVFGTWYAKIRITNAGNTIASARVRFIIDKDPVDAGAIPSESQLDGLVAEAEEYAGAAEDAAERAAITYGSPLTAATASAMTDINRVYVYTGSESGYTYGNWYYYNGSAWVSGGVYNSAAVETDTTLTESGVPADAKATGDKIDELKDDLNYSKTAPDGYILTSTDEGNGTKWSPVGLPTDEQTAEAVSDWLNDHPEATTTVQDGSLTYNKLVTGTLGFVTPEMFGAKGDGETDDRTAIQNAIDSGKPVVFSGNTYLVSGETDASGAYVALTVPDDAILIGNNATIQLTTNNYGKYKILKILQSKNVYIDGLNIVGDKDTHIGSTGEQGYGISIIGSKNIHINNSTTANCWGDGVNIASIYQPADSSVMTFGVYLTNFESYNNRRQGISVEGCDGLYMDNIYIHDISGTSPQAGIDFEPSAYTDSTKIEYIDNVFVSNYRCENTVGYSVYIEDRYSTKIGNYVFCNCIVENFRIVTLGSDGGNGSKVHLDNIVLNQRETRTAFTFHIENANTVITGNNLTAYRNGTVEFATFEVANAGKINFNNVSLIGGDATLKLFNVQAWSDNALANVVLTNLYAPTGCIYTTANNENKAQSKAQVTLAKDFVDASKQGYTYFTTIANVYYFGSDKTANTTLCVPWLFDGYEVTIINESDYTVTLIQETNARPKVFFDSISASQQIRIAKGIAKLKFSASLGAWILQNYIGDVSAV